MSVSRIICRPKRILVNAFVNAGTNFFFRLFGMGFLISSFIVFPDVGPGLLVHCMPVLDDCSATSSPGGGGSTLDVTSSTSDGFSPSHEQSTSVQSHSLLRSSDGLRRRLPDKNEVKSGLERNGVESHGFKSDRVKTGVEHVVKKGIKSHSLRSLSDSEMDSAQGRNPLARTSRVHKLKRDLDSRTAPFKRMDDFHFDASRHAISSGSSSNGIKSDVEHRSTNDAAKSDLKLANEGSQGLLILDSSAPDSIDAGSKTRSEAAEGVICCKNDSRTGDEKSASNQPLLARTKIEVPNKRKSARCRNEFVRICTGPDIVCMGEWRPLGPLMEKLQETIQNPVNENRSAFETLRSFPFAFDESLGRMVRMPQHGNQFGGEFVSPPVEEVEGSQCDDPLIVALVFNFVFCKVPKAIFSLPMRCWRRLRGPNMEEQERLREEWLREMLREEEAEKQNRDWLELCFSQSANADANAHVVTTELLSPLTPPEPQTIEEPRTKITSLTLEPSINEQRREEKTSSNRSVRTSRRQRDKSEVQVVPVEFKTQRNLRFLDPIFIIYEDDDEALKKRVLCYLREYMETDGQMGENEVDRWYKMKWTDGRFCGCKKRRPRGDVSGCGFL